MPNMAGVWQALQGIGVVGILLLMAWMVTKGAYITRGSHDETIAALNRAIAEMEREVAKLEAEVSRLQSALAARQGDDDD